MQKMLALVLCGHILGCKPADKKSPNANEFSATSADGQINQAEAGGSVAVSGSIDARMPVVDDPDEEVKVVDPAVIGGAFLYCDADKQKPPGNSKDLMDVGCVLAQVSAAEWTASNALAEVKGMVDGAMIKYEVSKAPQDSKFHLIFAGDLASQGSLEMTLNVNLPQGALTMTSSISTVNEKLSPLRLASGIAFIASNEAASGTVGTDRKSWNLWMPVKIPSFIPNLDPGDPKKILIGKTLVKRVELVFDTTICSYEKKSDSGKKVTGAEENDFLFVACSKPTWLPGQWIRSKVISLTIPQDERGSVSGSVGALLETTPKSIP